MSKRQAEEIERALSANVGPVQVQANGRGHYMALVRGEAKREAVREVLGNLPGAYVDRVEAPEKGSVSRIFFSY
jgi:hypothetical protein